MEYKNVWGCYNDQNREDEITREFLELLITHNFEFSPGSPENQILNFNNRDQLFEEFSEEITDLIAETSLILIKDNYDMICRELALYPERRNELEPRWFEAAQTVFGNQDVGAQAGEQEEHMEEENVEQEDEQEEYMEEEYVEEEDEQEENAEEEDEQEENAEEEDLQEEDVEEENVQGEDVEEEDEQEEKGEEEDGQGEDVEEENAEEEDDQEENVEEEDLQEEDVEEENVQGEDVEEEDEQEEKGEEEDGQGEDVEEENAEEEDVQEENVEEEDLQEEDVEAADLQVDVKAGDLEASDLQEGDVEEAKMANVEVVETQPQDQVEKRSIEGFTSTHLTEAEVEEAQRLGQVESDSEMDFDERPTVSGSPGGEGRDISIQEFKKAELLGFYNNIIDTDLILLSNRNIHLKAIHQEFNKFSSFATETLNQEHFEVFLIPVFLHLYMLLKIKCGDSDAESFCSYFQPSPVISGAITILSQYKTDENLQRLIDSHTGIRVKLSSKAYTILMNWFKDCFSESAPMFNILRVLHENFHVDIYHDKDDEVLAENEWQVLKDIEKWMKEFCDQKTQKESGDSTALPTDGDILTQNISNLNIGAEAPKTPEFPVTSRSKGSEKNESELKSSMFKLREPARRYLEHWRQPGYDMDQIEKALMNPPDFTSADPSVVDDVLTQNKPDLEAGSLTSENQGMDEEMDFLEDPGTIEDNAGSSPLENTESPKDSEYLICSDASRDSNKNDDDTETQESMDYQDLTEGDGSQPTQSAENMDQDPSNAVTEGVNEEPCNRPRREYIYLEKSYKTDVHSVYPITFSGKDVICSSDVSSDCLYVACGFESLKICTWRLNVHFNLEPIGELRGHEGIVYALSIVSSRKIVISGSHDCTVRLWDIEESKILSVILTHSAPIYAVCASPNYFLTATEDKEIALFDYDEEDPIRVYKGHSNKAINCVQFHPNQALFASASSDGNLFLFAVNDSCPKRMFSEHVAEVYALAFSPCGKNLASADIEGKLIIWDILTYTPIKRLETSQEIRTMAYDNKGAFLTAIFYYNSWKIYSVEGDITEVLNSRVGCVGVPKSVHVTEHNKMVIIQFVYADKSEIARTKDEPKTFIEVNKL